MKNIIEITTKQIDEKRSVILAASTYKISFNSKKIGGVHIAPASREKCEGYSMDTTMPWQQKCMRLDFVKAYSANQKTKMFQEIRIRASEQLSKLDTFIFETVEQKENFRKILNLLAELN